MVAAEHKERVTLSGAGHGPGGVFLKLTSELRVFSLNPSACFLGEVLMNIIV